MLTGEQLKERGQDIAEGRNISRKPAIDYLLEAIKITVEAGMFKEARELIAQFQKEVGGK